MSDESKTAAETIAEHLRFRPDDREGLIQHVAKWIAAEQEKNSLLCAKIDRRDAEIARLKAELAEARERTTATVSCSRVVPDRAEIASWLADWSAGKIGTRIEPMPPAPPADDPRIAALCLVVWYLADHQWPSRQRELLVPDLKDALTKLAP